MSTICKLPSVGPYVGVSRDETFTPKGADREIRVLIYGAYNAMGLIGSECNGIAILDETNKQVLTDEIAKEPSGYYGPSGMQLDRFETILELDWERIRNLVNGSDRARVEL